MLLEILLALAAIFCWLYYSITKRWGYFTARGVKELPSSFPFGSYGNKLMFTGKRSFLDTSKEIYFDHPNEKIMGYFSFGSPVLVINDLDLVKKVLIKDFEHFTDRRTIEISEENEINSYVNKMLTNLHGEQWKAMRAALSPVFTSGKLKNMARVLDKIGDDLVDHLEQFAEKEDEFDMRDAMVNFTLDAIAKCGLGVEAHSFTDPDGPMKTNVSRFLGKGRGSKAMFKILFIIAFPKIAKFFKVPFLHEESSKFLVDVVRKTLQHRRESKIRRNDLVDLCLDALKSDTIDPATEDDQFERDAKINASGVRAHFSDEDIESYLIANAFVLFFAGFDTSSNILSVMMYYLARNPDIQDRLHEEIKEKLSDRDGKELDYAFVHDMQYLDMVVHETLRSYPLINLERVCVKDYHLEGTGFTVPKDMLVQIPSAHIMKDAKYFPDPHTFNPEHFSPENKAQRSPYAFLGFGQGPRNCIGMRFALTAVKIAALKTLAKYQILTSPKTVDELVPDPKQTGTKPKGGIFLKLHKRDY